MWAKVQHGDQTMFGLTFEKSTQNLMICLSMTNSTIMVGFATKVIKQQQANGSSDGSYKGSSALLMPPHIF